MKTLASLILALGVASAAAAQTPRVADPRQVHYQIGVMERVLEGAVEHGAANIRDRLQAVAPDAPAQLLILDNPRVRGFQLDGYGVFFDVEVPSLNGTLTWSLQVALPSGGARLAAPVAGSPVRPVLPNPRNAGAAANAADRPVAAASVAAAGVQNDPQDAQPDPILENPNEAYRTEVVQALADAMVDYSGPLAIADGEWLTIAARGIQDRPRLARGVDNDTHTVMIRLRGADLAAFRAGQISRDDVYKRIERRSF